MPDDNLLPSWAVNLTVQIAELNAILKPHTDWVERNVKDHETRLRAVEATKAKATDLDVVEARVAVLESETNKNAWLPKVAWLFIGAAVPIVVALLIK